MNACPFAAAHAFVVSCSCGYRTPTADAVLPTQAEIVAWLRGAHRPWYAPSRRTKAA